MFMNSVITYINEKFESFTYYILSKFIKIDINLSDLDLNLRNFDMNILEQE